MPRDLVGKSRDGLSRQKKAFKRIFLLLAPLKKLQAHTNFVKGIAWDPASKYLASQSDDKRVLIWRVSDWKPEKFLAGPFGQSGGTAFFYRLHWSPDGGHLATAHAFNSSVPVSTLINRDDWNSDTSFVGHSAPIVVTRFSPVIYSKIRAHDEQQDQGASELYTMCAVGSEDHSLSIWLSNQPRPLVVVKGIFDHAVLDLSWTADGTRLLACSYDGTVAYMEFSKDEMNDALPSHERDRLLEKYGLRRKGVVIPESSNQLDLEAVAKKLEADRHLSDSVLGKSITARLETNSSLIQSKGQTETKTKEGRKRITPQFIRSLAGEPADTTAIESTEMVTSSAAIEPDLLTRKFSGLTGASQTTLESSSQEIRGSEIETRAQEFVASTAALKRKSSIIESSQPTGPSPSKKKSRAKAPKSKDEESFAREDSILSTDLSKPPLHVSYLFVFRIWKLALEMRIPYLSIFFFYSRKRPKSIS
jgi:protein HIRA/HIR1